MSSGWSPPPYKPPDNGLNPLALLNLLQSREELAMKQQALQQDREKAASDQYMKAIESGMDPETAAHAIPGLSVADYNLGLETAKALKKKQQADQALSAPALEGFRASSQGTLGPNGQWTPPSEDTLAAPRALYSSLPELLGPDRGYAAQSYLNTIVSGAQGEAQSKAAAAQYGEAADRRALAAREASSKRTSAYDVSLREGAQIRAEKRAELSDRNKELRDNLTGALVATQTGEIKPEELTQVFDQARQSGMTANDLNSAYYNAAMRTTMERVKLLREQQSVDKGRQQIAGLADDYVKSLDQQGFDTKSVTQEQARLLAAGKATVDPISMRDGVARIVVLPGGQGEIDKFTEGRIALQSLRDQFGQVESSFRILSDAVHTGRVTTVGPGVPDTVSALTNFLGSGSPEANAYRSNAFLTISSLMQMRSGKSVSQFELQNYLALLPSLQDAGTPQGMAKLQEFRKMLDIQAANTGRIANVPKPQLTDADRAIADKIQAIGNDPAKLAEFLARDLPEWQKRRGDKFRVPGLSGPPSQAALDAVRAVMEK
jgi:hypothetical protein